MTSQDRTWRKATNDLYLRFCLFVFAFCFLKKIITNCICFQQLFHFRVQTLHRLRDVSKNMALMNLASKGFLPIFVLDLVLHERKTKLEEILVVPRRGHSKLHFNRLFSTILRKFISSTTFLTFRENQEAKEKFVSVDKPAEHVKKIRKYNIFTRSFYNGAVNERKK